MIRTVLVVWIQRNHDAVTNLVLVSDACGILAFVVLEYKLLLFLLDVLPVYLKGHFEEGILAKN